MVCASSSCRWARSVAGTKYRGTFEERLREIVKEAKETPGIVLFIDEIHTLVGAGRTRGRLARRSQHPQAALARGEITVIGATTNAEFRRHFESDSALERRFQPITIEEPSEHECIELLSRIQRNYEEHHAVQVRPSAVEACVKLAVRYVPDRRLPDKALDLLDESCAEASLSGQATVDDQVVAKVVSDRTGPGTKLTEAERARMSQVERVLGDRVVGQSKAINALANAVRLAKAGLRMPERPRGVFLFQGPRRRGQDRACQSPGGLPVPRGGCTHPTRHVGVHRPLHLDAPVGSPPGYSGHGDEGQLAGPLRKRPYSVALLDEFEKPTPMCKPSSCHCSTKAS